MAFIIDEHNIAYFNELPPEAFLASLDDFHRQGQKHLGMPFICQSPSNKHFVIYRVHESLSSGRLKFFIDLGLVYVFKPIPQCVTDYYSN